MSSPAPLLSLRVPRVPMVGEYSGVTGSGSAGSESDRVLIDAADEPAIRDLRLYLDGGYCWIAEYPDTGAGGVENENLAGGTGGTGKAPRTLHQYLMRGSRPEGELAVIVDHISGDTLDCRRCNLRWASHKLNSNNKAVAREFLGVSVIQASESLARGGTQLSWDPCGRSHPYVGFCHKRMKWLAKPFMQYDLGCHADLLDAVSVVDDWMRSHAREDDTGLTASFPLTQPLGSKRPRLR